MSSARFRELLITAHSFIVLVSSRSAEWEAKCVFRSYLDLAYFTIHGPESMMASSKKRFQTLFGKWPLLVAQFKATQDEQVETNSGNKSKAEWDRSQRNVGVTALRQNRLLSFDQFPQALATLVPSKTPTSVIRFEISNKCFFLTA